MTEPMRPCAGCGQMIEHNPKQSRCPACIRAYRQNWRAENRDRIRAYFREYHAKRPGRNKVWREANREKVREYGRRYARKARAEGRASYPVFDRGQYLQSAARFEVYDAHGGICWLCEQVVARTQFHLDHVIPVSKGGPSEPWNLRPTHPACNMKKSDALVPFTHRVQVHVPQEPVPPEVLEALADLDIAPGMARLIDGRWLIADAKKDQGTPA